MIRKKPKPKEPNVVAEGKGWFKLIKTKKGIELRLLLKEYTAAKLEKEDET